MTTVLIGQNDQLQGHEHTVENLVRPFSGGFAYGSANMWLYKKSTDGIVTDGTNGTPRVGDETRGKNLTVRYWKRIA